MNENMRVIQTNEEFKIFADPYRMKIIDVYSEKGTPMTVKMVADFLNEVPAKVHYHVQKLLRIKILELDHIKVINGINAKYYILKHTSFKIDIKDDSSPKMKEFQIDATQRVILKHLDTFKNDVIARATVAKTGENIESEEGFISQRNLYLSDEEIQELKTFVFNFTANHSTIDESKTKYTFIAGTFMKEK
jgi:hypothetical protein